MSKKPNIYRYLNKEEILNIIKLIDTVESYDTKSRFYLVTLKYKSIDIQNFTLVNAENLVNDDNIPKKVRDAISKSLIRRKISIVANKLSNDTKYLFVNNENKHIHDCVLLREWRRFLKDNNLEDINIHVFKHSISHIQWNEYLQQRTKENGTFKDEMEEFYDK